MSKRQPSTTTTAGAAAPAVPLRRAPARLRLVPPDAPRRQAVKALGVAPLGEPVLGVGASTFRLSEVLDGGVLLVRLPPTLGEDTVRERANGPNRQPN